MSAPTPLGRKVDIQRGCPVYGFPFLLSFPEIPPETNGSSETPESVPLGIDRFRTPRTPLGPFRGQSLRMPPHFLGRQDRHTNYLENGLIHLYTIGAIVLRQPSGDPSGGFAV